MCGLIFVNYEKKFNLCLCKFILSIIKIWIGSIFLSINDLLNKIF